MLLNEYKQLLDNLDPYFAYSDDHKVYKAGQRAWQTASRIANSEQGLYLEAWEAYNDKLMSQK